MRTEFRFFLLTLTLGVGRDSPENKKDAALGASPPGVHPAIVPVRAAGPTEDEWIMPAQYQSWSVSDAMKTLKEGWRI